MDKALYVRVRGRVLGPYEHEKLLLMVHRGQLGRMHEVSTDGTHWVRASTYPELFVAAPVKLVAREMPVGSPPPAANQAPAEGADNYSLEEPSVELPEAILATPPSPAGQQWYYDRGGKESGPVDESVLRQLLASRELAPSSLVWRSGMQSWMAASEVPGLIPAAAVPASVYTDDTDHKASDSHFESLYKTAASSRPWVTFLAVTAFVYSGLWLLLGFCALAWGADKGGPPVVAAGLFWIINAVVVAVGGILLAGYANRLGSLHYSKSPIILERALEQLRIFWTYISIVLIVVLAFVLFFAIWFWAIATSMPRFM